MDWACAFRCVGCESNGLSLKSIWLCAVHPRSVSPCVASESRFLRDVLSGVGFGRMAASLGDVALMCFAVMSGSSSSIMITSLLWERGYQYDSGASLPVGYTDFTFSTVARLPRSFRLDFWTGLQLLQCYSESGVSFCLVLLPRFSITLSRSYGGGACRP